MAETGDPNDLLGVIVSYSVKVTLRLSGMGGELEVDLPFKLNHPKPGILIELFLCTVIHKVKCYLGGTLGYIKARYICLQKTFLFLLGGHPHMASDFRVGR